MKSFILKSQQEQIDSLQHAVLDSDPGSSAESSTRVDGCACPHLLEWLPNILDLTLVELPEEDRGVVLKNAVHSLHLESQIKEQHNENTGTATSAPLSPSTAPTTSSMFPNGVLFYGEQHARQQSMLTEGMEDLRLYPHAIERAPIVVEHAKTIIAKKQASAAALELSRAAAAKAVAAAAAAVSAAAAAAGTPVTEKNTTPALANTPSHEDTRTPSLAATGTTHTDATTSAATNGPTKLPSPADKPPTTTSRSHEPPINPSSETATTSKPGAGASANTVSATATIAADELTPTLTPSDTAVAASNPPTETTEVAASKVTTTTTPVLTEERFDELRSEEDHIRRRTSSLRTTTSSSNNNSRTQSKSTKKTSSTKKRKRDESPTSSSSKYSGGMICLEPCEKLTPTQWEDWQQEAQQAQQVEVWMEQYRSSRETYWEETRNNKQTWSDFVFGRQGAGGSNQRCCQMCSATKRRKPPKMEIATGDRLMQCLECSFLGCGPNTVAPGSRRHMMKHLLLTGHNFAVTCGPRASLFCFKCGDFVYHPVFDQERERIDIQVNLPKMAWKEHAIQRSFDPFQFTRTNRFGIMWKGLVASYPQMIPNEHILAARSCRRRQELFGDVAKANVLGMDRQALRVVSHRASIGESLDGWRICAPVGLYNLGNTCFQSAILQCLVNCLPLQRFFLKDIGHHHKACEIYRKAEKKESASPDPAKEEKKSDVDPEAGKQSICLACEMDKLFLKYYSSTIGFDVMAALEEDTGSLDVSKASMNNGSGALARGEPLVTSDMLAAAWKMGGMNHLAGYSQRDAHEYLHAFLDIMGKNICQSDELLCASRDTFRPNKGVVGEKGGRDVVKKLFEGTLRSVLVCGECGSKRTLSEPFLNVSLPLSKEVERATAESAVLPHTRRAKLSVDRCLLHFTLPENLADPVDCPSCKKKTQTRKQHTFSKLPKVLCLHLKRFDAARNRKIDDFVSFPSTGLNLGPHLPHWREVTRAHSETPASETSAEPKILYDLFGTVNHHGTLQSGHYVSNVKVRDQWFHCNDGHVSKCGEGNGESSVLKSDGAYLLFYIRR